MRSMLCATALLVTLSAACQDVRAYRGMWSGNIIADANLMTGFTASDRAMLVISAVDLRGLSATLSLPPWFVTTPFECLPRAAGDALGELKVGEHSLRSYLAFADAASGPPALLVVTLLPDERVELRVVRGTTELYGLFLLRRTG